MRGSNGSAGMDCDRAAREQPYIQGLAEMKSFEHGAFRKQSMDWIWLLWPFYQRPMKRLWKLQK
jgi:hypothetical protein